MSAETAREGAPVRIQRKRTKGWRMPANTVYVGRPTKFGNPFEVGKQNPYGTITKDIRHSCVIYLGFAPQNAKLIASAREELKGANLACFCGLCDLHKDGLPMGNNCPYCQRCHADILLRLANEENPYGIESE